MRLAVTITFALLTVLSPALAQSQGDGCRERLPADRTTIDLRSADVPTTLRLLAERYRVSLIISPDAVGTVTMSLYEVPVRDVFDAILRTAGLACVVRDDIAIVAPAERLRKEVEATREQVRKEEEARSKEEEARRKEEQARSQGEAEARKKQVEARQAEFALAEQQARGPLREETIRLAYADAEDVAKTLQGILGIAPAGQAAQPPGIYAPQPPVEIPPTGTAAPLAPSQAVPVTTVGAPEILAKGITVSAHKPTNSVFIRHYESDLARIKRLVQEQLDVPLPQVQIAAQLVVILRNALEQIGVQWGGGVVGGPGQSVLGRGLAQPVNVATQPGLVAPQTTGTPPAQAAPSNPGFTRGTILPVDPSTGLPTGGNIVSLPISSLPTTANPALGLLWGIVGRNFNFNLAIQALETQGKARSLAEPKTVTVENSKAIISRGFEVPYVTQTGFGGTQVQFKDALLKLEVTPRIIREAAVTRIRMKIIVENNEPDFTRSVLGQPSIFKRRAENEVVVREGERLVIGGVLTDSDNKFQREVPGLGRIPVLGWLFKSRELSVDSQEMVVVVTPTVLPANR